MNSTSATENSHRNQPEPLLIIGLVALALVVLAGIGVGVSMAGKHTVEVSAAEAAALRDQGALFLDVRTPEEWNISHVSGSTLIPLDELAQRANEVPRDRVIVVVCETGVLSRVGRSVLLNQGFTRVFSMKGGLSEWQAQGYLMVTDP